MAAFQLFRRRGLEAPEEIEGQWRAHAHFVDGQTSEELPRLAATSTPTHNRIVTGLLCVALTAPPRADDAMRLLQTVTRDGHAHAVSSLAFVIDSKFHLLHWACQQQVVWATGYLVAARVGGIEGLVSGLMQRAKGGCHSHENRAFTLAVLDLLATHSAWLHSNAFLVAKALFTFLRLIGDHWGGGAADLRSREVAFCAGLLKEHPTECLALGRDLARLLQDVANIPEFQAIWRTLILDPQGLDPAFSGLPQLLRHPTSRRMLASRLTPRMEEQLLFILTKVRRGQEARYLEWFEARFLSTPESETLVCDLIRYISCCYHPPNQVLCSDILERWVVVSWLLGRVRTPSVAQNAKLALFYDWLVYDGQRISIMNIEPALLVMYHSLTKDPKLSATLLEFLCLVAQEFYRPMKDDIVASISAAFRDGASRGVLPSVGSLLCSSRLDTSLRSLIAKTFPDLDLAKRVVSKEERDKANKDRAKKAARDAYLSAAKLAEELAGDGVKGKLSSGAPPVDATDAEDEASEATAGPAEEAEEDAGAYNPASVGAGPPANCPPALLEPLMALQESEFAAHAAICEQTLLAFAGLDASLMDDGLIAFTAQRLGPSLSMSFDTENASGGVAAALFAASASQLGPQREQVAALLLAVQALEPRVGYHLLLHPDAARATELYRELCARVPNQRLAQCLFRDLKLCRAEDAQQFFQLVPLVYTEFASAVAGDPTFLRLVLAQLGTARLNSLSAEVALGRLSLFRRGATAEGLSRLFRATMAWPAPEQAAFWRLFATELCRDPEGAGGTAGVVLHCWSACLGLARQAASAGRDPQQLAELEAGILRVLQGCQPTVELVSALAEHLLSDEGHRLVSAAALVHWARLFPDATSLACLKGLQGDAGLLRGMLACALARVAQHSKHAAGVVLRMMQGARPQWRDAFSDCGGEGNAGPAQPEGGEGGEGVAFLLGLLNAPPQPGAS